MEIGLKVRKRLQRGFRYTWQAEVQTLQRQQKVGMAWGEPKQRPGEGQGCISGMWAIVNLNKPHAVTSKSSESAPMSCLCSVLPVGDYRPDL